MVHCSICTAVIGSAVENSTFTHTCDYDLKHSQLIKLTDVCDRCAEQLLPIWNLVTRQLDSAVTVLKKKAALSPGYKK